MFGRRDEPAFDRIIVQIFQLLKHDGVAHDCLRVRTFLPDLMLALGLGGRSLLAQLAEEPVAPFGFQLIDEPPGRVAFQVSQDASEIGSGYDGVEVGIEDDPGMDLKAFMLAAVLEGINENVAAESGGKDGEPRNGSARDEMGVRVFEDSVPAAHGGGLGSEAKLQG